jgi:hypothetical protein
MNFLGCPRCGWVGLEAVPSRNAHTMVCPTCGASTFTGLVAHTARELLTAAAGLERARQMTPCPACLCPIDACACSDADATGEVPGAA